MDHNKLWKILKEMGIPDHLTCLLRNLYAGQEVTVRTGHGTISSVQSLSRVQLFATPWTAAHQASLPFTISWSLFKFMSIESVMKPNQLILATPFSWFLQSFPASGSFPVSWLFPSGGQSIRTSTSVLPMNIQDWDQMVWSLCSPRDSQESSLAS